MIRAASNTLNGVRKSNATKALFPTAPSLQASFGLRVGSTSAPGLARRLPGMGALMARFTHSNRIAEDIRRRTDSASAKRRASLKLRLFWFGR